MICFLPTGKLILFNNEKEIANGRTPLISELPFTGRAERICHQVRNFYRLFEESTYLTLMTAEKADRNDLAYGVITKGLKNLAKELDCVVVLLTQLNRALESRTNKRPLPSDSRDTGQIEQDCDYWVGIHREGAFDDSVPPGETELILRLNRHGNTGTVYCIQANGAIYDTDQQSAEMRRREREEPQSKKKGGF